MKNTIITLRKPKNTIYVELQSGCVVDVKNIPKNTKVVIIDYDVEGFDNLKKSPVDGEPCMMSEWS